ncbi:NUDIX domain-containing protein [Flavonifractor plautii]|nr:NUDIX domain-containing protein [Flavonifractor plautii]
MLSRRAAGAGEDAVSCALRETWEELGIPRYEAVEVVAELDWLTHQGGFVLYPVLGIVAPEAGGAASPRPRRGEGRPSLCRWTGCGPIRRRCMPTR